MSTSSTSTVGPDLTSAGPLLFHPDGVLFVADVSAATIIALEVQDDASPSDGAVDVSRLDAHAASLLGVDRDQVAIRGMAVHPRSHAVYLSVARGLGAEAAPALVRIAGDGALELLDTSDMPFSRFDLDDAPAADDERQDVWLDGSTDDAETMEIRGNVLRISRVPLTRSTITDMAWADGVLLVAGTSNEEFTSRLRRIPFPFDGSADETSLEIYHVDHGQYETMSPIRRLIPFDGGRSVLATYTCTPVATFPVDEMVPGALVRGRTVAELGPMNQPLGLLAYRAGGEEWLLVSGTRHPLIRIPASAIAGQAPLTEHLEPVGVPRDVLDETGVTWMANLDDERIVVLQDDEDGTDLRTLELAAL